MTPSGQFMAAAKGHRFERLYLLTLFTGLRQGEVLGLTWDCVDFAKGTLLIDKQLQRTPGHGYGTSTYDLAPTKSDRARKITAPPFVLSLLKQERSWAGRGAPTGWPGLERHRSHIHKRAGGSPPPLYRLQGIQKTGRPDRPADPPASTTCGTATPWPLSRAGMISRPCRKTWDTPPPSLPWMSMAMLPTK